jgi:hypothetical protein
MLCSPCPTHAASRHAVAKVDTALLATPHLTAESNSTLLHPPAAHLKCSAIAYQELREDSTGAMAEERPHSLVLDNTSVHSVSWHPSTTQAMAGIRFA